MRVVSAVMVGPQLLSGSGSELMRSTSDEIPAAGSAMVSVDGSAMGCRGSELRTAMSLAVAVVGLTDKASFILQVEILFGGVLCGVGQRQEFIGAQCGLVLMTQKRLCCQGRSTKCEYELARNS